MNAAVIKVAFANPPREGKKRATVKTDKGELFLVYPDKLGLFRPGKSYRVEFSTSTYQGKDYHTITKWQPIDDETAPAASTAPSPSLSPEFTFVTTLLAAAIKACTVANTEAGMVEHVRMARAVYRRGMG